LHHFLHINFVTETRVLKSYASQTVTDIIVN